MFLRYGESHFAIFTFLCSESGQRLLRSRRKASLGTFSSAVKVGRKLQVLLHQCLAVRSCIAVKVMGCSGFCYTMVDGLDILKMFGGNFFTTSECFVL